MFKNESTNQLKNTLKMSKEDVKLLLVKFYRRISGSDYLKKLLPTLANI